jgi:hypothetical protein
MRLNADDPEENSYAHPVEGLHAIIDADRMEVIRIDDFGIVPVPQQFGTIPLMLLDRSAAISSRLPSRSLKGRVSV